MSTAAEMHANPASPSCADKYMMRLMETSSKRHPKVLSPEVLLKDRHEVLQNIEREPLAKHRQPCTGNHHAQVLGDDECRKQCS